MVENNQAGFLATEQYDVEKYIEAIKILTPEKVQEVFSQLINPDQFYLALYGPSLEADVKIPK